MLKPSILLKGEFSQYEDLFTQSFPGKKAFSRGEVILGLTDRRDRYCYYIKHGIVACTYLDDNGNARTSTMRGRGSIFPLYYTHKATTIEQTLEFTAFSRQVEVIPIPKTKLHAMMLQNPDLGFAMMDAWGAYCTYILYNFETQFEPVRTRVCSFLLLHSQGTNRVKIIHSEIAKAIGATRENVTRALAALQSEGIVALGRGHIDILDEERLLEESSYVAGIDEWS